MNWIAKFLRIEGKSIAMELSSHMAYKLNFFIKCSANWISDFIGPIFTLLIYSTTLGIPGWSMYEFLLFQGTVILVFGFGHGFVMVLPYNVIENIRDGEFDKYLVKPFNTLFYILSESFDSDGLAEILAGGIIIIYSMVQLGINVVSWNFFFYIILILAGCAVQFAVMVFVSALAFLVVRSESLMNLYSKIADFARYPLTVYSVGLQFFLTFLFPIAVSSFYPATVLIKGATPAVLASALIPVFILCIISIIFWNIAMKKYSSAGG